MDIVNKSKALNILIPRLIDRSNSLTREIKSRMKLNKIFSEFENKASNNLNYFITASNHRYTSSKLGNDLDSIISSTRAKNINEATKIINDNFYKDSNLEIERQKMKYKSTNKINKDIKDIFNKMKLPLETKFSNNNNREIQMIIKGMDNQLRKERIYDNNDDLNERKEKISSVENVKRGKNTINDELEKEQISIENTINKYLNNINNVKVNNIIKSSSNSPSPHKKQVFKLPKIKLINYKKYKPPKRKITTEEDKKPDIKKLLPYSSLGKNYNIIKKNEDSSLNENDLKNLPFITEPNFIANKKNDYHNTLNVVYNSANNEFKLQNSFDEKRRKLEDILGINNIPKLDTYDDIAIKKSEKIKNDRHKKAKKISESQKFAVLSRKAKVNMIIENDMDLLDKLENKIYNNANNYLTK
jgi:hypothetical protein